ncbi:MAG: relaxase/mobilization nuclease domain-containing protein [Polyangiaceae bacterium]
MSDPNINPLNAPGLGMVLDGPARPKGRKPKDIRQYAAQLMRVARKVPEVVIKVRAGGSKGPGHVLAHMTYITRNGKIDAYNERDEKISGNEEVKEVFKEWGFSTAKASTRQRAQTVNFVLSMPEGTDPEAVLGAARAFAKKQFGANHQYLLALHTPETDPDPKAPPHPHVHLSVKAQGYDLTWLKRTKEDLQRWREDFAEKLRDRGVEAEATPRKARGVVKKSKSQAMHHFAKEPKRSRVIAAKVEETIRDIDGGAPEAPRPWDRAIQASQAQVRETYAQVEQELRQSRHEDDRKAADQLAGFLRGLPPVETERKALRRQIETVIEGGRDQVPGGQEPGKSRDGGPIGGQDMGEGGREK